MKRKIKKMIEKISKNREKLKNNEVKKIGIFGSSLKNKINPSDVDVLVEFKKTNADNYFNTLEVLERIFKKKVDLVIKKDLRPELEYVKKEAEYVKI